MGSITNCYQPETSTAVIAKLVYCAHRIISRTDRLLVRLNNLMLTKNLLCAEQCAILPRIVKVPRRICPLLAINIIGDYQNSGYTHR